MASVTVGQKQRLGMTGFNGKDIYVSATTNLPDDASHDEIEMEIAVLMDITTEAIRRKAQPFLPFVTLPYKNPDGVPDAHVVDLFMGKPIDRDDDVTDSESRNYQG